MSPQDFLFVWRPFTWAWGLLACAWAISWMPPRPNRRVMPCFVWGLVFTGFSLLLAGLGCRMIIARRLPMTTMYESILWTAMGIILFAMCFQAFRRSLSVFQCALPVAIVSLILADLPIFSNALGPLPPILRHPFWLVSHVITITLSYAAFAIAMAAGHWAVWQRLRGQMVSSASLIHHSLQIGVGLLTVGILLGAFWAQSAWGRFWGWDPKETWALITLLCYLALLHGRRADLWSDFGLAIGSILAFQTLLMTWYGVNCLLPHGLHNYGFGAGGFKYILSFGFAEGLFIAVAIASIRRKNRERD